MNEDMISGNVKKFGGTAEQGVGKITGDAKLQAEGLVDQAKGVAQDAYGQVKGVAQDAYGQARETFDDVADRAVSLQETIEDAVRDHPLVAIAAASAFGFIIGQAGRLRS